ncbi:unnamed protein product [Miscanthus lutarioriparius]|uniref:Uncharacterized protein n=1 Tax=Miscanthus lutarioriparius TaxID=422564 RepID=A0A811MKH2_9POAL|nr:unnamed protein product [Miscanthus lutarioriparius]
MAGGAEPSVPALRWPCPGHQCGRETSSSPRPLGARQSGSLLCAGRARARRTIAQCRRLQGKAWTFGRLPSKS